MNQSRVDALNSGHDATLEVEDDLLQDAINNHGFKCTTCLEDIRECNFYVVAVPTPVDNDNHPDLRPLWGACVVGTLNHLLFLSNKISDHEVSKMIRLRINDNKEILKYLLNTRSLNNRVWGYFSCLLLGKITMAYNILYRFRSLFS